MVKAEVKNTTEKKVDAPAPKKSVGKFFSGLGRRKRAVARVWLYNEKGEITINDKPITDVYTLEEDKGIWVKPFHLVGVSHPTAKFSGTIKVNGGGRNSQLEAVALGIARALSVFSTEYDPILRKQGLLRRDPRETEPKKYYLHKARRAPQYSKR